MPASDRAAPLFLHSLASWAVTGILPPIVKAPRCSCYGKEGVSGGGRPRSQDTASPRFCSARDKKSSRSFVINLYEPMACGYCCRFWHIKAKGDTHWRRTGSGPFVLYGQEGFCQRDPCGKCRLQKPWPTCGKGCYYTLPKRLFRYFWPLNK